MNHQIGFWVGLVVTGLGLVFGVESSWADGTPPASVVKLVFVHHSTGGNWLAAPNDDQPFGNLGATLMNNHYYVSATNYGWGPEGIGDRTDIPNWPEWFTGSERDAILAALYGETSQNLGGFGSWPRLAADPGGENQVILFKSCYPNSDLFGNPDDLPASVPNEQFSVANAKAVYNNLLTYFETRLDKLFVVVTAPPQNRNAYGADYQTPEERAANARAFNNWLVHDWLAAYPHANVCVFDYFNVLTGENNHHRLEGGAVQHVTAGNYNFSAYPSDEGNSHPNTAGQSKATAEFVPLLNACYNRFAGNAPVDPAPDIQANGQGGALTVAAGTPVSIAVSLNPGGWANHNADWWVVLHTPLAPPADWFSYVFPAGWQAGIRLCAQAPLFFLPQPVEVLNIVLPPGGPYDFYFVVDDDADGVPEVTWHDAVTVNVE